MPSPASSHSLAGQLRDLISVYLARQRRHAHAEGFTQADRLLMLLGRHGPATQTDFGRIAGLDKSWISRIVERYVADGLVERRPHETDRRCIELHLTPAGQAKARHYDSVLSQHAEALFDTIPAAQHAGLETSLGLILQHLHNQMKEEA